MVFLIPLIIIVGIVFAVDIIFFADEDAAASAVHRQVDDSAAKKQKAAQDYLKAMIIDELDKSSSQ